MSKESDPWLDDRLARYDRWVAEGRIPYSSKVIPVRRSLDSMQWILPTEQVLELLRNARIYNPEQQVYAVCSCCACCCHDLQFLSRYGRSDLIARSDYVAEMDPDACVHCGQCVERCVFGARVLEGGEVVEWLDRCRGCGLCVTVCPTGASQMALRPPG